MENKKNTIKEKIPTIRNDFIKFLTSVEEIEETYTKEVAQCILRDEIIRNIVSMKTQISYMPSWSDITIIDDKNVIATFDYPKRQVMKHFYLNQNQELELVCEWEVHNHYFSGEAQILRDAGLYFVTEGAYTTKVYDYQNIILENIEDRKLTIHEAYRTFSNDAKVKTKQKIG